MEKKEDDNVEDFTITKMCDDISKIVDNDDGDRDNWNAISNSFESTFNLEDKVSTEKMYQALVKGYTSTSLFPTITKRLASGNFSEI